MARRRRASSGAHTRSSNATPKKNLSVIGVVRDAMDRATAFVFPDVRQQGNRAMRVTGDFTLGATVAALLAGAALCAPAAAATLSVGYAAHHAYHGTDSEFFTGTVLAGSDLFRVDLDAVVSKYIGETEKNLDVMFGRAGTGSILLFFEEDDALFGKRTDVKDSHDRYAQNFIVLDPLTGTWHGQIVLGKENGFREDGVYELSGRYADLVVAPVPAPPALALLVTALGPLGLARRRSV